MATLLPAASCVEISAARLPTTVRISSMGTCCCIAFRKSWLVMTATAEFPGIKARPIVLQILDS